MYPFTFVDGHARTMKMGRYSFLADGDEIRVGLLALEYRQR